LKLVIVGEGPKLPLVKEKLSAAGIDYFSAANAQELRELVPTLPVLVYVPCDLPKFVLEPDYQKRAVSALHANDEIVFLMDAAKENTPYEFSLVFDAAIRAARMMRPVTVLSRTVRGSFPGAEHKYTQARDAGVRFIRYDDIEVERSVEGVYTVSVTEGTDTLVIETPCLVDCSPGSGPELLEIAKELRLKVYKKRYITNSRWFDHNKNTSRRNVYVLFDSDIGEDGDVGTLVTNLLSTQNRANRRVAMVDKTKCAFCYTCYRICPHSAPVPDLTARAMLIPEELCDSCGACVAACPANAIAWDEPLPNLPDMKPVLMLCCENSAYVAASAALDGLNVEISSMPCGGVISTMEMAKAMGSHSGILVAVCINGACKHYDGNLRAIATVGRIKKEIAELGLDSGRIEVLQVSGPMENVIRDADERLEGRINE